MFVILYCVCLELSAMSATWTPEQRCCRSTLVEFGEFANPDTNFSVDAPSWDRCLPYDSF